MDPRLKPVVAGIVAGVALLVLPEGLGPVVVVVGALAAGWSLPSAPMPAAVLFLVPAIVLGSIRVLVEDDRPAVGALLLALVMAVLFIAIFTHVGAGIVQRRQSG